MAAGTKLVLNFLSAAGKDIKFSFNYAKDDVESSDVKALVDGIITNGIIYEEVPVSTKSAKIIITDEADIDLSAE